MFEMGILSNYITSLVSRGIKHYFYYSLSGKMALKMDLQEMGVQYRAVILPRQAHPACTGNIELNVAHGFDKTRLFALPKSTNL